MGIGELVLHFLTARRKNNWHLDNRPRWRRVIKKEESSIHHSSHSFRTTAKWAAYLVVLVTSGERKRKIQYTGDHNLENLEKSGNWKRSGNRRGFNKTQGTRMSETLNHHPRAAVHRNAAISSSPELLTVVAHIKVSRWYLKLTLQELLCWQTQPQTDTTETTSLRYRCVRGKDQGIVWLRENSVV